MKIIELLYRIIFILLLIKKRLFEIIPIEAKLRLILYSISKSLSFAARQQKRLLEIIPIEAKLRLILYSISKSLSFAGTKKTIARDYI